MRSASGVLVSWALVLATLANGVRLLPIGVGAEKTESKGEKSLDAGCAAAVNSDGALAVGVSMLAPLNVGVALFFDNVTDPARVR